MNNRRLLALAAEVQGKSAAEVDTILRRVHLDPQERAAVKHQAAAGGHTVRAGFELATDQAGYRPPQDQRPKTTMERLLERVGLDDRHPCSEAELNARLDAAGLDTEQRLAVKIEAEARGLLRHVSATDKMLQALGIDGPMTLMALERLMDQRGMGSVTMRTCVRAELQRRGWLKGGGGRSMQASAAQGTLLVDSQGRPRTLRSRPA